LLETGKGSRTLLLLQKLKIAFKNILNGGLNMKFDALIIAGGKNNKGLKNYSNKEYESLIEVAGKPMVQHVIKAVENSNKINKIVILGPKEIAEITNNRYEVIKPVGKLIENIKEGFESFSDQDHIFLTTADIPLVTPKIITGFIEKCEKETSYELFYPLISKKKNEEIFPGVERTYVHLKEGTYTGGNFVLVSPKIIKGPMEWYGNMLSLRKKPFKMSKMLGLKFVLKLLFRKLSISETEKRISEIIGHKCKALIIEYPEISFDVDKPSDLKMMREKYIKI